MEIQRIPSRNYDTRFCGVIRLHNLKKGKITKIITSPETDNILRELLINESEYTSNGAILSSTAYGKYIKTLAKKTGINLPKLTNKPKFIRINEYTDDSGYRIPIDGVYNQEKAYELRHMWDENNPFIDYTY